MNEKPTHEVSRLALHACCGPCLIEPYDAWSAAAEEVVVVFYNPNIHPIEEYERRRETLRAYAETIGARLVEMPYDPQRWLEQVGPHAADRESRCSACYRLRLDQVAEWAARNGFDTVATTLSVSPYQDPDAIAEAGALAVADKGVSFRAVDFRDRYATATSRSRELGMYRQNYCGCLMSDIEAREERAARKAAKRQARSEGT